jgi:UDP-N-acetylglucosamine transferase subunit ALG13
MILVTVGTEKFPFNRLMGWIEQLISLELIQEEVVIQYGACTRLPEGTRIYRSLPEAKFRRLVEEARLIISHCGEGSLLLLDTLAKPYILVPRSQHFKEHVDDHQLELASILSQYHVPIALSPGDLLRFLASPQQVKIADLSSVTAAVLCQRLKSRFG